MNRLRCFLFATIVVVISSATFALGGEIQTPAKTDPTPIPTPTALTIASTSDSQFVWQDATTMFVEILLTIF
jgi:hypothetical protein